MAIFLSPPLLSAAIFLFHAISREAGRVALKWDGYKLSFYFNALSELLKVTPCFRRPSASLDTSHHVILLYF